MFRYRMSIACAKIPIPNVLRAKSSKIVNQAIAKLGQKYDFGHVLIVVKRVGFPLVSGRPERFADSDIRV